VLDGGRVRGEWGGVGSDWGSGVGLGVDSWGSVGGDWGGDGWGSVGWSGVDSWGGVGGDGWENWSVTVEGGGSGWLVGIGAWLVGRDRGSVAESVSDVVDGSDSAIVVSETVRAGDGAVGALLLSEGTTGSVVFVVGEGVVTVTLKNRQSSKVIQIKSPKIISITYIIRSGDSGRASVDDGWDGGGRGDDSEEDEEFHFGLMVGSVVGECN